MRVVFETNIFISSFVIPGILAEKAISKIIEGRDELVISKDIIREVLSVLSSKVGQEREALGHVVVILSDLGKIVKPDKRVRVFRDESDNKMLECAIYGEANLLVTGDKEILRLREYKGIKIISLKEYLEL